MAKKITLLGSTGSIGTQSLDVVRAQGYEVFGLSAHSQTDKILQQIEEFHPKYVCMTSEAGAEKLSAALAGRADAPRLLTCNFLYYDWTGSTSKMPAPARQPRCRCGHGDTFLIMPL